MGYGYAFTCTKCHHEYSVFLGDGMMYPKVFRSKLDEIASGAYGEERKKLLEQTEYAAVDAANVVYICTSCNRWEAGTDVTLYAPNDSASISKKQHGIKTVEEWGYVPYVSWYDLKQDYHVLKRYYHKCENCGRRMHKASKFEEQNLACPECGEINETTGTIFWD